MGQITNTHRSTPSPIPIQTLCTVAIIEAIDALYQLIESPTNFPACESACEPKPAYHPHTHNGKRLHPTKVLAIRSMLLETNDMYAISEALDVTYNTVAYHKRKMDRMELNGGLELRLPVGRRRIIGPEFVEVCIYKVSIYVFTNISVE
jgi:hypothetical protein